MSHADSAENTKVQNYIVYKYYRRPFTFRTIKKEIRILYYILTSKEGRQLSKNVDKNLIPVDLAAQWILERRLKVVALPEWLN